MSRNSAKQRMTQLMEWLPTLSSKRNKRVNSKQSMMYLNQEDTRRDGYKQR
jgi:hypothetical protein